MDDAIQPEGKHSVKKKGGAARGCLEFVVIIVIAVVLAFLLINFVARPYQIPSGSMEPTIEIGDRVLSERVSYYGGEPQAGQIVTFTDPNDPDRVLIKRCIATGGQTVELVDGAVWVDGQPLDEPYTYGKPSDPEDPSIVFPYTVPQGYIWVMGDNRTNSSDSRTFGAVPAANVTGHAFMRYWPFTTFGFIE